MYLNWNNHGGHSCWKDDFSLELKTKRPKSNIELGFAAAYLYQLRVADFSLRISMCPRAVACKTVLRKSTMRYSRFVHNEEFTTRFKSLAGVSADFNRVSSGVHMESSFGRYIYPEFQTDLDRRFDKLFSSKHFVLFSFRANLHSVCNNYSLLFHCHGKLDAGCFLWTRIDPGIPSLRSTTL